MTGRQRKCQSLANPRWERFAQLIVEGLMNGDRKAYSQGRAYIAAGYEAKDAGKRGGSAEAAASRLLNRVKPIIDRVRELQAEATKRLQPKLDLSRERIGRDLDQASRIAAEQKNASAMVASALGIAKVFHAVPNDNESTISFKSATSMHDIGRKLLMTVGMQNPPVTAIEQAIEANDAFVSRLEEIASSHRTIDAP